MHEEVTWALELGVQPGRERDFRALMEEMVASARDNEPGTLTYEWSVSADGARFHTYERFADSGAALRHLATFGDRFAGRFVELFRPLRFVVYGSPNQAVRDALAGFDPEYMQPAAGFSR